MERPLKKVKTEKREFPTSNLKSGSDDPANEDEDDSIQVTSPPALALQKDDDDDDNHNHAPPDDSVQVVGTLNSQMLPHMRPHCTKQVFWNGLKGNEYYLEESKKETRDNQKCCALCFCYVCDKPAKDCKTWDSNHCHATDRGPNAAFWKAKRQVVKEKAQGTVIQHPAATRTATAPTVGVEYAVVSPKGYLPRELPSHTEDFAGQFFGGGGRGGPGSKTVLQVLLMRVFVLVAKFCVEKKIDPHVGIDFYDHVFSVEIVPGYKLEYLFDCRRKAIDIMKNVIKRVPLKEIVRHGLGIRVEGWDANCAWEIAIRGIQGWKNISMRPGTVYVKSMNREWVTVTHANIVQGSYAAHRPHQHLVEMKRHQSLINAFFTSHEHENVLTSSMLHYLVKVRGLYIEFKCKLGRCSTQDEIRQAGSELNDLCGFYPKSPKWKH
jgi:hypothetical protein